MLPIADAFSTFDPSPPGAGSSRVMDSAERKVDLATLGLDAIASTVESLTVALTPFKDSSCFYSLQRLREASTFLRSSQISTFKHID